MSSAEDKQELVDKLTALAVRRAGGAAPSRDVWVSLFYSYDRDGDRYISPGELTTMLEDADISNFIFRDMWVDTIIRNVDQAGFRDGRISLEEFMVALKHMPTPSASVLAKDGVKRVKELVDSEFTPKVPSFDGGVLLLLGIGALVLLSGK